MRVHSAQALETRPGSPTPRLVKSTLLALLVLPLTAVGAQADPPITEKRAQAQAIVAEVDAIAQEVDSAAERYNGARYELQQLDAQLADARGDLRRAKRLQTVSQRRIAARLRSLYVNGDGASTIEVLLGATSLDEMIDQIEFAKRVAEQDATIARQADALRERVEGREKEIAAAHAQQAVVVERMAAEKQAIEARLAERQRLLASVEEEVAQLEEAERRRQADLRRQAELELERQQRREEPQAGIETTQDGDQLPSADGSASVDSAAPAPDATKAARVVAIAMQYLGVPYQWGGASPSTGFDCSGLTMYVFAQVGVSLPHYAAAQFQMGVPVSMNELEPGDLVFFYRDLGHVGIYIGGGSFIHAPQTGDVVKISALDEYYVRNWAGARRLL